MFGAPHLSWIFEASSSDMQKPCFAVTYQRVPKAAALVEYVKIAAYNQVSNATTKIEAAETAFA